MPDRWNVELTSAVVAGLRALPREQRKRVAERIDHLAANGLPPGLRDELDETLGASGVLLYPPHWTTAPRHNRSLWLPIRWMHTALFNVLHCPVTQVPTGLDSQGLPTGVQVVGARGQDHLTIAAAVALEESLGGWQPPAQFEALEQPNPSR